MVWFKGRAVVVIYHATVNQWQFQNKPVRTLKKQAVLSESITGGQVSWIILMKSVV